MPKQPDNIERKTFEEVGDNHSDQNDKQTEQVLRAGRLNMLTTLMSDVINPFKPSPIGGLKSDPGLYQEAQKHERDVRNKFATLKVGKIKEAAQNKIGQFNDYAAHKGTVPQTVANLYLGKITSEQTEAINMIYLEAAHNNFMATINELQTNYSMQNECTKALHRIKEAGNAWKSDIFDFVVKEGMNYLFK
jgi:hypothetical protein